MKVTNSFFKIPVINNSAPQNVIPQSLTTRANMPALVSTDPVTKKEAVVPMAFKDGSRMSTFRADSYTKDNPVYIVKYWDAENNYKEDGSIKVPEVLWPYMGGTKEISKK